LVLGANLGTAVNPVLEGSNVNDPASRRLPVGNLGTRVAGCVLGLALLPWIPAAMDVLTSDASRAIANFHTLFNIAVALLFFPLLEPYAAFVTRMFPKRANPDDPTRPLYLDESAHEVPDIALGNAAREALRVADMLQSLLGMSRASLASHDRHRLTRARYVDNAVNRLETLITTYLATTDRENMNKDDYRRLNDIMAFITNVSRAASVVANRMLLHTDTLTKHGWAFSKEQREELIEVIERLMRNQRRMTALFMAEDVRSARYLAYEKDHFRQLEAHAAEQHLSQIKTGKHQQAEVGSTFLDMLRDAKTINSHLVEAAAYPILARHDELLPNRLRETDG
ncbi:MAG TPA: Na/Pi cotransporter family protein, partial [Burkholderiaceae bacterium]|nr:Na/Pi cotransporter family protein [Burkholderiaceae bacterium]